MAGRKGWVCGAWALGLLLLTLPVLGARGTGDVGIWARWTGQILAHGLQAGYALSEPDYPPISFLWLAANAAINNALGWPAHLVFKLSLWLCLLLSAGVLYAWQRSCSRALLLYAACLVNALSLGYLDIYFVPPLLLAAWGLVSGRHAVACFCFSWACFTKWQPVVAAPFILVYLLRCYWARGGWQALPAFLRECVLPALAVPVCLSLFFGVEPMWLAFRKAMGNLALSGQALNASWVLTWWLHVSAPDMYGALQGGKVTVIRQFVHDGPIRALFWCVLALAGWRYLRQDRTPRTLLLFCIAAYAVAFVFNTGVHENHWLAPMVMALALAGIDSRFRFLAWGLVMIGNLNLLLFYNLQGGWQTIPRVVLGFDTSVLLAAAVTVVLPAVLWRWSGRLRREQQVAGRE